jgi:hypothetical protein
MVRERPFQVELDLTNVLPQLATVTHAFFVWFLGRLIA